MAKICFNVMPRGSVDLAGMDRPLWRRSSVANACHTAGVRRLLIRPGAIGDFPVSLPALECLMADNLEIWTATETVQLARFANGAWWSPATGLDLAGLAEFPPRLMEELRGFGSIVSW